MSDDLVKSVARAWASIDGKPYGNAEGDAGGYTEGYEAEAEELLRRSELSDRIEALKAERHKVQAEVHAAAIEAAGIALNARGIAEQEDYGLGRETQNFYRARDIVRALHTDASRAALADRDARIKREAKNEALREAAGVAYRVCAETRHITLGDTASDAITALIDEVDKW